MNAGQKHQSRLAAPLGAFAALRRRLLAAAGGWPFVRRTKGNAGSRPVSRAAGSSGLPALPGDPGNSAAAPSQQVQELFAIFNGLEGAVCVSDLQTRKLLAVNQYFRSHFGEQWEGRTCYELRNPGCTAPCSACAADRLVDATGAPNPPLVWESQDPKTGCWYQRIDRAIPWPDGRLVHLEVAIDITARRQTEDALRRTSQVLDSILTSASEYAISAIDRDFRVIHFNPAAERLFGYPAASVVGQTLFEIHARHQISRTRIEDALRTAARDGKWESTLAIRHPGRPAATVQAVVMPMRDEAGAGGGFVLFARDVTRELALEAQLREAQTLEAIGRLAGGVAHEFNNALAVILGHYELAAAAGRDHAVANHLRGIRGAAERAAQSVRQLLAFSRRQVVQPRPVNLNEIVAGTVQMLRPLLGEDIRLELRLEPVLAEVRADRGQMELLITNLCTNARDAMAGGGTLTIETSTLDLDRSASEEHALIAPGRYVTLAVCDTGHGMDADTRARLFEPFFSTKAAGTAAGLGLATVYGIVQQHGGRITVHSVPRRGTTFRVYLPCAAHRPATPTPTQSAGRPARDAATILLVEDEEEVRDVVRELLEAEGYAVLAADHGGAALELVGRRHDSIDLLVTDVVMPGLTGAQLAERAIRLAPGLRVLFISGHAAGLPTPQGQLPPDVAFLAKPFTRTALVETVAALLAGPPSRLPPATGVPVLAADAARGA